MVRFCSLVQAYLLYVVRNLRKISGFIYSPIHMLVQLYRDMLRFSCKVFYYESNILFFLVQSHLWLLSSTDRYLILGQYHHCFRTDIWFIFMVRFVGIFQNPIKTMILLIKESVPSLWKEIKKKLSVAISIIIIIIFYQNYILLYFLKKNIHWYETLLNQSSNEFIVFCHVNIFFKKKLKLDLY
jgi:hypothetical protein